MSTKNRTKPSEKNGAEVAETSTESAIVSKIRTQIEEQRAQLDSEIERLEGQREALDTELNALYELRGDNKRVAAKRSGTRVSWDEFYPKLPKVFSADDLLKFPEIAAKGRAQVHPALNRWEKGQKIKKVAGERGKYRKLAA